MLVDLVEFERKVLVDLVEFEQKVLVDLMTKLIVSVEVDLFLVFLVIIFFFSNFSLMSLFF